MVVAGLTGVAGALEPLRLEGGAVEQAVDVGGERVAEDGVLEGHELEAVSALGAISSGVAEEQAIGDSALAALVVVQVVGVFALRADLD